MKKTFIYYVLLLISSSFIRCAPGSNRPAEDAAVLRIDGSSSVYPITEYVVEKYKSKHNNFSISLGVSGTGGGFEKFVRNEIEINNASRAIKEKEMAACDSNKLRFFHFEVAFDGIAVVVNKDNDWVKNLSVDELHEIWREDGAELWSDINPEWPAEAIKKYGPGEASGTYDYFKDAILREEPITSDYTPSENDNLLAKGISNNIYSIGFFGLAYFKQYQNELNLIAVDNGKGPINPNQETVASGQYAPLARAMYIYVNEEFGSSREGKEFLRFYLDHAGDAADAVGYVALPTTMYEMAKNSL